LLAIFRAPIPAFTKLTAMPDYYRDLLDATIEHLDNLKHQGERWIQVRAETLAALAQPAARVSPPRRVATALRLPAPPQPPAAAAAAEVEVEVAPTTADAVMAPPLDSAAKAAAMDDLRQRVLGCVKCPNLVRSRRNVVFGVGDIHALVMFV